MEQRARFLVHQIPSHTETQQWVRECLCRVCTKVRLVSEYRLYVLDKSVPHGGWMKAFCLTEEPVYG